MGPPLDHWAIKPFQAQLSILAITSSLFIGIGLIIYRWKDLFKLHPNTLLLDPYHVPNYTGLHVFHKIE